MGWSDDDVWNEQLAALAQPTLRRGYAHASLSAVAWGKGNVEMLVEEIPIKMARWLDCLLYSNVLYRWSKKKSSVLAYFMLTFSEPPSFTFNLKIQNSTVNLRGLTKCAPFWLRVGTPSSCSLAWQTCVYVFGRITLDWHDMFHDFWLAQLLFDLKCFTPQLHPYTNMNPASIFQTCPPPPDFWGHQKCHTGTYFPAHQGWFRLTNSFSFQRNVDGLLPKVQLLVLHLLMWSQPA